MSNLRNLYLQQCQEYILPEENKSFIVLFFIFGLNLSGIYFCVRCEVDLVNIKLLLDFIFSCLLFSVPVVWIPIYKRHPFLTIKSWLSWWKYCLNSFPSFTYERSVEPVNVQIMLNKIKKKCLSATCELWSGKNYGLPTEAVWHSGEETRETCLQILAMLLPTYVSSSMT